MLRRSAATVRHCASVRLSRSSLNGVGDGCGIKMEASLDQLEQLYDTWAPSGGGGHQWRALVIANLHMDKSTTAQRLDITINQVEDQVNRVYHKLRQLNAFTADADGIERLNMVKTVRHQISCAKNTAYSLLVSVDVERKPFALSTDDDPLAWLTRMTPVTFGWDGASGSPLKLAYLHVLRMAKIRDLRILGDTIFEPIQTSDGHNTFAFRPKCTVEEFIAQFTNKDTHLGMYLNVNTNMTTFKELAKQLRQSFEDDLEQLCINRNMHSFTNGIYFSKNDLFVEYHDSALLHESIPRGAASAKYFDIEFTAHLVEDWRDISIPELESVLTYQGMPPEVIVWFLVMIGRLLHSLTDRMDSWQVVPFLFGVAGEFARMSCEPTMADHDMLNICCRIGQEFDH